MPDEESRSIPLGLLNQFRDDASGEIRQSHIEAAVADGQTLVIDPEQVQQSGLEIVDVDGVLHGSPADFVGGSVNCSAI